MRASYDQRAPEYDDFWLGVGGGGRVGRRDRRRAHAARAAGARRGDPPAVRGRRVGPPRHRPLVVIDSAMPEGEPAEDWQERILSDGSRHRVYKRWFTGPGLAEELGGGSVLFAGRWFVAVSASAR